nr:glycosyltransferase family 1 protein [uncultured Pedobacter sp.]
MQKIKIYFDNTIFRAQKIGGISIVFCELLKRLNLYKNIELNMIANGSGCKNFLFDSIPDEVNFYKETKLPKFLLPFFPIFFRLPKGSIFHTSYTRYSFQRDIKRIITIHDLGYEHGIMRKGFKRSVHLFFKRIAIKYADGIICVSQNTYDDLYTFYGDILKDKSIKVIYNGLSEEYFLNNGKGEVIQCPYILYVGGRQLYKNFEKTVIAVSELKGYKLVVAGGGDVSKEHLQLLDKYLSSRYSIKNNLSTGELKQIYGNAFCLVYPSSYEGFGLPLLEAMASGCPVVCCDNSCIAEITNNAAILITAPEIPKIKEAIITLQNEDLRQKFIKKGEINAEKFSWENTVKDTILFYENIIST